MNLASEVLEADHDEPAGEGGKDWLENLSLAHQNCNRTKRNLSNDQVRPYLRFRRFMSDHGGRIKYDKAVEHWDIEPRPSAVKEDGDTLSCEFADHSKTQVPIFTETASGTTYRYAFLSAPRVAIVNDAEVQPRIIRHAHAYSIYMDLLTNPLHEPPSCRLGPAQPDGLVPLLMFDGQHKTVASWMCGRGSVVIKLYLNMSKDQANYLVNSIQAKIKKLPLSAFELSAKMSDEWSAKIDAYELEMARLKKSASEAGFIKWIPAGQERTRAKNAFKAALAQSVLSGGEFRLLQHVESGAGKASVTGLTENMVKSKVIDKMLELRPLNSPFTESTERRIQEVDNITWMVNQIVDELVDPTDDGDDETTPQKEARRRLFKQGSLQYVAELLTQVYRQVCMKGDATMLDGTPTMEQRDQIERAISNITCHPVWTAELDRDEPMAAVKLALEKNQNVKEAFTGVALTLSYAIVGRRDHAYSKYWR